MYKIKTEKNIIDYCRSILTATGYDYLINKIKFRRTPFDVIAKVIYDPAKKEYYIVGPLNLPKSTIFHELIHIIIIEEGLDYLSYHAFISFEKIFVNFYDQLYVKITKDYAEKLVGQVIRGPYSHTILYMWVLVNKDRIPQDIINDWIDSEINYLYEFSGYSRNYKKDIFKRGLDVIFPIYFSGFFFLRYGEKFGIVPDKNDIRNALTDADRYTTKFEKILIDLWMRVFDLYEKILVDKSGAFNKNSCKAFLRSLIESSFAFQVRAYIETKGKTLDVYIEEQEEIE